MTGAERAFLIVIKPGIVGFADERINGADIFVAGQGKHIVDEAVGDAKNVEGAGEQDGRFQFAQFI